MDAAHHHQEPPRGRGGYRRLVNNPRLLLSAFFLSLVFFTFGFDGSVGGGILAMAPFVQQFAIKKTPEGIPYLTATDISILTALPSTGCLLGLPLAAALGDRIGRKKTLLIGCAISAVGAAIQTSAFGIAQMVVGRWIANVAIFIFIVMASTFLAEIAPENLRGSIVGLSIVLIDSAGVLSAGVNWAVSTNSTPLAYRLPLGLQIAFAVVIAAGILFLDDSPTFYMTKSRDEDALRSLRRVRRGYTEAEVEAEFSALKSQAALREAEQEVNWQEMFRGTNLRRTLLALSIGNMQQLSGIAFATNYVTIFLAGVGVSTSPFLLTLVVAVLALAGAVTGMFLVDAVGRRPLALSTFSAVFVIDLVIGVLGFQDYQSRPAIAKAIAAFSCIFAFFFACGFGPLTYVVASEIPTARLRNKTSAFSFLCLACFSTVVVYVLPYISQPDAGNLGAKTYLIFAGWMAGCILLTYIYLPETKGRTPAELDVMFEARVPARKFASYIPNVSIESSLKETKADVGVLEVEHS
ncbi:related to monosaccharide transporter [Cephalotrichum gorgonifer]|uniref:Related to monosaccharide transporter n=1 Tax=Cephalotrichum gorgonifer TaxID=2041049 RepID=A0AAE8N1A1_9PEZI|nr:related to monosaccharide transporter [Cephalotrichum gorgonifer]